MIVEQWILQKVSKIIIQIKVILLIILRIILNKKLTEIINLK